VVINRKTNAPLNNQNRPMSELALQRIRENIEKHRRGEDARMLDLGNCGMTDESFRIPPPGPRPRQTAAKKGAGCAENGAVNTRRLHELVRLTAAIRRCLLSSDEQVRADDTRRNDQPMP
jgi:hypothetical protein